MKTITDHKWKPFKYRHDVPQRILDKELDWCTPEDNYVNGFIHYRNTWYHLGDFMRTNINGYHGYAGDSYFSGVAIKISEDGEEYQIATLIS